MIRQALGIFRKVVIVGLTLPSGGFLGFGTVSVRLGGLNLTAVLVPYCLIALLSATYTK